MRQERAQMPSGDDRLEQAVWLSQRLVRPTGPGEHGPVRFASIERDAFRMASAGMGGQ